MKIIRTVLVGLVLAGGLLSSVQVASADPGGDKGHAKKERVQKERPHPVRDDSPVQALLRSITWE